jgi:ElaB/YqjD/DUF883 family membrane-anchored ribosome-binding protein
MVERLSEGFDKCGDAHEERDKMPDMTYGYKENQAGQLAEEASNAARKAKDSLAETAKTMKDKTQEFGRDAMNKIEENRVSAAGALHDAASTMHQKADKLPNGPDMAHSAADRVDAVASYLQAHDTKQMMADVETVVRRNPGPSLLVAGALGFLIGRAFRSPN